MNLKYTLWGIAFIALVTACNRNNDPCENVVCSNGGVCSEGICLCEEYYYGPYCDNYCVNGEFDSTCVCNTGYEGEACETEEREKFVGTHSVHEECITSTQDYFYTVVIKEGNQGIRSIEIHNFRDDETYAPVEAYLTSSTEFVIDPQKPKGSQELSGNGYINDTRDTIIINYELKASQGSNKEICTMRLY
ncbi:MAG: hypothetical protein Kow0075_16380 [Salibacteraceae bacterium]